MATGDIKLIIDYQNGNIKTVTNNTEKEFKKSGAKAGKNFSSTFGATLKTSLKGVAALGAALAAVGGVVLFKSIQAAKVQEDAVNRLNTALKITGKFSQEASDDLQAYASSLQATSKFGDEAILSAQGLIQSLGGLEKEGLKGATKAALDLSAALGIDLNAAAVLVGKAATGEIASFSRYGVMIKSGATAADTFANALTALNSKFGGAAAGQIETYAGAVQQAENSFGDMLEKIGDIIIKQPLVIKLIKESGALFNRLGEQVIAFGKTFNIFDDVIDPILAIGTTITEYVIPPLELFANIGKIVFASLKAGVATIIQGFGFLGQKIAELLNAVGVDNGLTQGLHDFAETSKAVANEAGQEVRDSLKNMYDFPASETLARKNTELIDYFAEQREIIDAEAAITKEAVIVAQDEAVASTQTFGKLLGDTFSGVKIGVTKTAEEMTKISKQSAKIVQGGLAKGVSGGIQNIIQSLAKGEDVFANFGNFLVGMFGDLAIQLGNFWIAQGIAVVAADAVSGTGAIAAGIALVAVGSLLKAFTGGGGGGGAAPSAAAAPATSFQADTVDEGFADEGSQAQAQTILNVNVDGNVNDGGAFIRDLAEQIGEESDKQGIVFNNFATV